MLDGLFTGKKVRDFFTPSWSDWINARRIINGLDRANDIARTSSVAIISVGPLSSLQCG